MHCLIFSGWLSYLSYAAKPTCLGIALSTVGWALLHQPVIKEKPHKHGHRPIGGRQFLRWGILFLGLPSWQQNCDNWSLWWLTASDFIKGTQIDRISEHMLNYLHRKTDFIVTTIKTRNILKQAYWQRSLPPLKILKLKWLQRSLPKQPDKL